MVTMHQDALLKAAAGMTSLEEILRVSSGDTLE
jgi:type II secretory ATPase GspE/PulE/Tfp pilus assembly ATPase PilB-like protein